MDEATAADGGSATVEWRRIPPDAVPSPVVRRMPYLELKLEHPGLEPSGHGDRFVPDAVPYELDGVPRVFYWRPALPPSGEPSDWELVCATTHELAGVDALPAAAPALTAETADGTAVVVDGTVGGDAMTKRLASYATPDVRLTGVSDADVTLAVEGAERAVPVGERRRIALDERTVEPSAGGEPTAATPELVARYPGRRELHHPALGAEYRLFPSFGLALDEVPDPLPVPTVAGELDHEALATDLGVDLSERPYPERVLWQALAYAAFDPHGDATAELAQLGTGHLALRAGRFRTD